MSVPLVLVYATVFLIADAAYLLVAVTIVGLVLALYSAIRGIGRRAVSDPGPAA